VSGWAGLLCLRQLAASHLLGLEVLVQEEQGRLIRLGRTHNGEHALASFVVRCLDQRPSATGPTRHNEVTCLTLAIEMRAPEVLRISLILLPARPMMQPTMSAGMLMF